MTVAEMIERLSQFDPEMDVRIAAQPAWPFEHEVGPIVDAPSDYEETGDGPAVVYIGEGYQIGYLPSLAAIELGWS